MPSSTVPCTSVGLYSKQNKMYLAAEAAGWSRVH